MLPLFLVLLGHDMVRVLDVMGFSPCMDDFHYEFLPPTPLVKYILHTGVPNQIIIEKKYQEIRLMDIKVDIESFKNQP